MSILIIRLKYFRIISDQFLPGNFYLYRPPRRNAEILTAIQTQRSQRKKGIMRCWSEDRTTELFLNQKSNPDSFRDKNQKSLGFRIQTDEENGSLVPVPSISE